MQFSSSLLDSMANLPHNSTSYNKNNNTQSTEDRKMAKAELLVLELTMLDQRENALLDLSKCVASHPDTRGLFLNAHIPLYLYPFLNTTSKTRPFEYLRLTSLGVIGALVKSVVAKIEKITIFCGYRACEALKNCLPDILRDATFSTCLREDPTTRRWLSQLLMNVSNGGPSQRMQAIQGGPLSAVDHMMSG